MKTACLPGAIPLATILNANTTSNPFPVQDACCWGAQVISTGTVGGNFKIQVSFDPVAQANATFLKTGAPTNWTDLASSSQTTTTNGNVYWTYEWPGYNWARIVFTDTSSGSNTGTITAATINSKSF